MNLHQRHMVFIHCLAVILLGMLIYANALTGEFQFDDKLNIVDNPLIRNLRGLWPPAGARWFGTLTFALNFRTGGLNPFGYHLVNIAIHILTALTVYALIRLTFRTPFFKNRGVETGYAAWFAAVCALVFVAHPIQTQAVTYIVQRFASLAALCYLLSLTCYIGARLQWQRRSVKIFLYVAAALTGILGIMTKENAVTLPLVIILYDLLFIADLSRAKEYLRKNRRLAAAIAAAAAALLIAIAARFDLTVHVANLRATNEISRHDYLITQFRVVVTYLRLLLVPTGQTVDHHYPVYHSIAEPPVAASMAALLVLLAAGIQLCRRSRLGDPRFRLIAFGIFWFFITLSVESGLIPIADVMFEHRLYLPSFGAILALTATSACLLDRLHIDAARKRSAAALIVVVVLISLGAAAHLRNRVWQSELSLWNDVIDKKPRNPRGYNMVGNYYLANFQVIKSINYFRKALDVDNTYSEARSNLGAAYIYVGRIDEGLNELILTMRNNTFDNIDRGVLYYNIAKGYKLKGMPNSAIEYLNKSLQFIPNEAAVYALYADIYRHQGFTELSTENYNKAHNLNPLKY